MKKILILIFLPFCSFTQVTERNILMNKYSLDFISQNLIPKNQWKPYPKTAEEWKATLTPEQIAEIITQGETALKNQIAEISGTMAMDFKRSGDRENHSKASYGRRNQLMPLILAENIENKNRFTEKIFNLVWAICEESFWGVPAHISNTGLPDVENQIVDLFAAETAALLGITDYLVGEKMDKINILIRKRIYFETNRRIFQPIKKWENYNYLNRTKPVNNWNPWIVSNILMANLFLENNEKERASNVKDYMYYLDAYLNGLGEDGGCNEGPIYWYHAGASVYDFLEAAGSATKGKINIYNESLIKKMGSFIYKMHIYDNYFVNFADADPKVSQPDGLMLYRFGKAINDEKMMAMGQWAFQIYGQEISIPGRHTMRVMDNLISRNKIPTQTIDYQPEGTFYINDIQALTTRTKQGLYLATHGGHNGESHNHNDVGDFIVYVNGEPVIIDPGRGSYTARTQTQRYELWFTQSNYHNLPIINGLGQKAGRNYEARDVKSNIHEKEASLQMNIASAYEKEAGVVSWNRLVKLNHQKNQVEISDDYELNEAKSLQQIFMTVCETDISVLGKISFKTTSGKVFNLNYDKYIWDTSIDIPSTEGMEYGSIKTKWDNKTITRIILNSKNLKKKSVLKYVLSPTQ